MRFVMMADLHGHFNIDVPDGDVLMVAGDISAGRGSIEQVAQFNAWLGTLPHQHKIVIAGNHDFPFDKHKDICKAVLSNAVYLEHEALNLWVDGQEIRLFGSPYHPKIWGKFELERPDLYALWATIPDDTEILMTHGPPKGIMDKVWDGKVVGDDALLEIVKVVKPYAHIFGHIHEGYGHKRIGDTFFFNASICNERYNPVNKPLVWDW